MSVVSGSVSRWAALVLVVVLVATVVSGVDASAQPDPGGPQAGGADAEVFEPGEVNRTPVGSRPSEPPPGWDREAGPDLEVGEELVEARSVSSKTFQGVDGGLVTEVFDRPVHHEVEPGVFVELDPTLAVAGQAGLAAAQDGGGPVSVEVPTSLADGAVRVVDEAGGFVEFVLAGAAGSEVSLDGERARYTDVFEGVDVEFEGTGLGVKELLVLAGPDTVRSFEFELSLDEGLSPSMTDDGGLAVADESGEVRFVFDAPFMFDDAPIAQFSDDIDTTLTETPSGWVWSWTADDGWLDDDERVWPVTIDPTVTIGGAASETCWISDPGWYPCTQDHAPRVGAWNNRTARALVRFDLDDAIGQPAQVRHAYLQMHDPTATGTTIGAHQLTTAWTRSEVSWTHAETGEAWQTAGGDHDADAVSSSDGTTFAGYRFDLPGLVQRWVDQADDNHGVLLKAADESDPAISFDAEASLLVEWTPLVGMHHHANIETQEMDDRRGLHVDVVSGNLMITDTDVQIAGTAGADLALTRTYNHLLADEVGFANPAGWRGAGRAFPYEMDARNDYVLYRNPDSGYATVFVEQPDGSYEPATRIDAQLERDGTSYVLTWNQSGDKEIYHNWGGIDAREDRSENRIQYYYDSSYRLSSVEDTQGRVTTFSYTSGTSQIQSMTDPVGRTHTFSYDPNDPNRLLEVEDPAGHTFAYDEPSSPDHVQLLTDTRGNQTRITYETSGQFARVAEIVRITDPAEGTGPTTSFAYDADERTTVVTDPNGNDTTYHYDAAGKTDTVIDALGNEQASEYDPNGNVETFTTARGSTTTSTHDPDTNNLMGVEQPTGSGTTLISSFEYDDPNNAYAPSEYTNTQGDVLAYGYHDDGRLNRISDESDDDEDNWVEYRLEYNDDGTVDEAIDPEGNTTKYHYEDGNLRGTTPEAPLGATSQTPDALSRVSSRTDGEGRTVFYGYDIMDRVTQITYPDLMVVYTYDEAGNVTSQIDATGTTTYQHDELNRLTQESRPGGITHAYDYDDVGNLLEYSDATGTVTYGYDEVNLLRSLEEPPLFGIPETTFKYDDDGNRIETVYPNGVTQTVDIDDAGRLKEIEATRGSTTLTRFTYDYTDPDTGDDTSLRHQVTDLAGVTTDYTYDQLSRLTDAVRTDGSTVTDAWEYAYDRATNRRSATHNGATTDYDYNAANQLTEETTTAGTTTFSYDGNGNLTGSDDGLALDYNAANQTLEIDTGTDLAEFAYAGDSQVERTDANGTTIANSALGVSRADSDAFIRDDGGTLISMRSQGQRFYYLFDGLGSVVGVTNMSGSLVNTYEYDPFGNALHVTEQVDNPWQFTAEWNDDPTGLYKIGHRYYNPDHGRWTQTDPLGNRLNMATPGEVNPYAYANCNPTNYTDPSGLFSEELMAEVAYWAAGQLTCYGLGTAASLAFTPFVGVTVGLACDLAFLAIDIGLVSPALEESL